jgi:toxin ParE1/3/4
VAFGVPERGTLREDLGPGLRTLGFEGRVTIAFRILPDRVQIVRIFYGKRDFEAILRRERFEPDED